ncbi:hypothetical protein D3C85_14290 [compost metagenome]
MASSLRLSRSGRLKPQLKDKMVFGSGHYNTLLFTFDDNFFERYGRFTDKINQLEGRYPTLGEESDSVLSVLTPYTLVDIALNEEMQNVSLSESVSDTLYDDFDEGLVNDVLDEVYKFYLNLDHPRGFWEVYQILSRNDRWFYLTDFYGMREHDSLVYVVTESE